MNVMIAVSGQGRTLDNLLGKLCDFSNIKIVRVVSDRLCPALNKAAIAGITADAIVDEANRNHSFFTFADKSKADLICLAGYLSRLDIPTSYSNRVMNIHPSLLPSFGGKGMYGLHVHKAVLGAGVKLSGCTVHFCDNEYDHGPIILQRSVLVNETDTPLILAERVFAEECKAYPEAITWFAEGRLQVVGRKVLANWSL